MGSPSPMEASLVHFFWDPCVSPHQRFRVVCMICRRVEYRPEINGSTVTFAFMIKYAPLE